MRRHGLGLLAAALVSLLLPACAPRGSGNGSGGAGESGVLLLRDLDAAGGAAELPSFVRVAVVPDGKSGYADRLLSALDEAAKAAPVRAVVALRPHRGLAEAIIAAKTGGAAPLLILISPADEALAAEAAADLVVDLDPAQTTDEGLEGALEKGLCELARRAAGGAKVDDATEIAGALRSAGGWDWKVSYRADPETGIKARNHVILSARPRG